MNVDWSVALITFLNTLGAGVWAIVAYTIYNRSEDEWEAVYERDCEAIVEDRALPALEDPNDLYNNILELESEEEAAQLRTVDRELEPEVTGIYYFS